MTCYTRHLDDILKELKMEDTRENRKQLDRKIRFALKQENDDCPVVWKHVKEHLHDPVKREWFIGELKKY